MYVGDLVELRQKIPDRRHFDDLVAWIERRLRCEYCSQSMQSEGLKALRLLQLLYDYHEEQESIR